MSLDAQHTTVTPQSDARVLIEPSRIYVDGFDAQAATCRDVSVLACLWAIGRLQQEVTKDIEQPGGGATAIGMPDGAPASGRPDTERLKWLLEHISTDELERLNIFPRIDPTWSPPREWRAELDAAMAQQPERRPLPLTPAARDVLAERERQVTSEGWTPEHDDEHDDGSLSKAAACYALEGLAPGTGLGIDVMRTWPWPGHWKPKDRRSNLVRAAALNLAEIERIDRATERAKGAAMVASRAMLGLIDPGSSKTAEFDTADVVHHKPSGEDWVVAYTANGMLCACGWPCTLVPIDECTLKDEASPEERQSLLQRLADGQGDDPRRSYARRTLAAQSASCAKEEPCPSGEAWDNNPDGIVPGQERGARMNSDTGFYEGGEADGDGSGTSDTEANEGGAS